MSEPAKPAWRMHMLDFPQVGEVKHETALMIKLFSDQPAPGDDRPLIVQSVAASSIATDDLIALIRKLDEAYKTELAKRLAASSDGAAV